ncbi:MAG TPA: hypothetical protein VIZ68_08000 [Thermoplasmata archaeon]
MKKTFPETFAVLVEYGAPRVAFGSPGSWKEIEVEVVEAHPEPRELFSAKVQVDVVVHVVAVPTVRRAVAPGGRTATARIAIANTVTRRTFIETTGRPCLAPN